MRSAETVLQVIRDRGKRGLLLEEDVYRQLYNPSLYLLAYSRIYKNDGALTQGVTKETADGMSMKKIEAIIEQLRYERFRWTPVRRVEIPKKNGKKRPLGIPTWTDKLVQEVIRLILEAFYEPQFSNSSHGWPLSINGTKNHAKEFGLLMWFRGEIKWLTECRVRHIVSQESD